MTLLKLGLLLPSSNTTMEQEFRIMLPIDVSIHAARICLRKVVVKELLAMKKQVRSEALKLSDANVDIIGFGCTTGSLAAGYKYDERIVERIEKATGKPAVATAGAVVEALKSLDLLRIAVATPYAQELNRLERRFMEENGFSVSKTAGLGLTDNLKIAQTTPEALHTLVTKVDSDEAEGIFISCTNLPTITAISELERTFGKPVVSSNTATLWAMLRKIKHQFRIEGFGKLFLSD